MWVFPVCNCRSRNKLWPSSGFSCHLPSLFFSLTSSFTSIVLSREVSYLTSGFWLGFGRGGEFKIFLASFFAPGFFICDDIKKTYLFALHETSESLVTVSCWSPLQSFHLLDYWKIFFFSRCFLTCFMSITFTLCLSSCFFFFLSLYLILPISWRYHNQEKPPEIPHCLPNPSFVFSVSIATAGGRRTSIKCHLPKPSH